MFKRLLDVTAAAAGLLLLAPAFALIALAIRLDTPGPVFYRQVRVGRHGKLFRIFKFRTMLEQTGATSPELTVAGDQRITRVGAFLRRTKLDELAQLIDVLRGTMSLVGPRPEVPRYVDRYPAEWRERLLSVRPGITDFASVSFRHENSLLAAAADPEKEYVDVILPMKLRSALHYVDNASMGNDLRVIGLTLRTLFASPSSSDGSQMSMTSNRFWTGLEQAMSVLSPRNRAIAMMVDAVCILACWHLTYLFRLGFEGWRPGRPWYDNYVAAGVLVAYLTSMAVAGVPRGPWRFFGFDDFKRISAACLLAGLVNTTLILMAQLVEVARAVLLLHPVFCILALSLLRMTYRVVWESARARVDGEGLVARRALVLGAGVAGRRIVSDIHRRDGWTVLALLDDDAAKQGLRVGGVRVAGRIADLMLPHVRAGATHVIVAMPGVDTERRDAVIALAHATGLTVMSVPSHLEMQMTAQATGAEPPA